MQQRQKRNVLIALITAGSVLTAASVQGVKAFEFTYTPWEVDHTDNKPLYVINREKHQAEHWERIDHPAYWRRICSFNITDFSVNAECLLIYGFHGFFNSSLIFCLSSDGTLGSSNSFGNNPFL